jgi:hypothetical protein
MGLQTEHAGRKQPTFPAEMLYSLNHTIKRIQTQHVMIGYTKLIHTCRIPGALPQQDTVVQLRLMAMLHAHFTTKAQFQRATH